MRSRLAALLLLAAPFAVAQDSVLGYWSTPNHSTVHVYQCGQMVCATLAKLYSQAPSKVDVNNPDPALRQKPLCGLQVGRDFQPGDSAHAKDGILYDPESGHTYHGLMEAQGDTLKLRGYVGVALFGRTEVWHRTQAPGKCAS